jgi:inner membrane protein
VLGAALYVPFRHHLPRRFAVIGALCAVAPDVDVVGFRFGIEYSDPLGHRGLTHSLPFAAVLAAATVALLSRSLRPGARFPAWVYLALATGSHGIFDALTNGGLGVALFAPITNRRFFFPWQPIEVSPLGFSRIFSARGLEVFASELLWVGVPALLIALAGLIMADNSKGSGNGAVDWRNRHGGHRGS